MRTNGTSQNILPIDEATVQERQVTVQVLTIGTKQVTQSLYKQLIKDQVIGRDLNLKGTVWGWVNLHQDCLDEEHLHIIWEDNGQLKQSYVTRQCPLEKYHDMKWWLKQLANVYLCKRGMEDNEFWSQVGSSKPRGDSPTFYSKTLNVSGQKLYAQFSDHDWYGKGPNFTYAANMIIDETHWGGQHFDFTSHTSIYDQMKQLAIEITDIENRWAKAYQTCRTSGQLFVAVSGVWK